MSILLVILAFTAGLAVTILRAIVADEVRGRIERRISASVEATIASLPPELRDEWADEWRAETAAAISMPVTAALLARGLRHSASQLKGDAALAPTHAHPQQHRNALKPAPERIAAAALRTLNAWIRRLDRDAIIDGLAYGIVVSFILVLFGIGIVIVGDAGVFGLLAACILFGIGVGVVVAVVGVDVDVLLVLACGALAGSIVVAGGGIIEAGVLAACGLVFATAVAAAVAVGVGDEDKEDGPQVTPAGRLRAVLEGRGDELVLTAEQAREVDAMLKSWREPPANC